MRALTADGKSHGYGGGSIDSSDQCDSERSKLRQPDSKDTGEPNCDGFEHRDGGTIDLAGECKWNGLQHDRAGSAGDGSGRCKRKLYSYVSAGDDGSLGRERNDHEQCESLTADGKSDGYGGGSIDSSNHCNAERGELREPDGEDINDPNCDGFEHGDGGTIDLAGECKWNGLQHDGAGSAGDGSGRCKRKLYSYVSAGDRGSGCRQRNDYEQCQQLSLFEHFA